MTLFTVTTSLHLPGKEKQTMTCLRELFTIETQLLDSKKIQCVLINEYASDHVDRLSGIRLKYPHMTCIQKNAKETGQAKSINLIFRMLRENTYKFWIHWEESWILHAPFLSDAMHVLNLYPKISQLQIAKGWDNVAHDVHDNVNIISSEYHKIIETRINMNDKNVHWKNKPWPLFSLQPGIDRVQNIVDVGEFHPQHNTVPDGKVNGSEFNFACRWYLQEVQKGVLTPFRAFRDTHHVSTNRYIT